MIHRRREELKHAQDIRRLFESKLDRINQLHYELSACMAAMEQEKRQLAK